MGVGFKSIETRTHDYFRGLVGERIAVHQGQRSAFADAMRLTQFVGASRAAGWLAEHGPKAPRGYIIATAFVASAGWMDGSIEDNVKACCPTDDLFGLRFDDICALPEPILARGAQGIWNWDGVDPWIGKVDQDGQQKEADRLRLAERGRT